MQFGNDILGKTLAVVVIIALTLHHRISGILAVVVIIAFMQNKAIEKEGFTPMVANSTVQNLQNYVKDNANNVKDKLKESFSRFRS